MPITKVQTKRSLGLSNERGVEESSSEVRPRGDTEGREDSVEVHRS